jgi:hypothetical protein
MPSIILIVALICLPVIIGACLATAAYKAYRTRHILEHDVERAQNQNAMPPKSANSIEMRDLESTRNHRSWPLSRTMPDIIPTNIAPAVKPLPAPKVEIKGVGGGYVEHWGPSRSVTRMADSDERVRRYGNEKKKNGDNFENVDLYAGPSWNLHFERNVSATPDIPAPQPMYTTALYGRYTSSASPTTRTYGEDARAADVWQKIERRESLVKNRVVAPIELPSEDGVFEDINLDGDSKEWREGKRPDTPVFVVGEEEQVENNEDEHTRYTPVHTPTPRNSFSSGRSLATRTSFPIVKQVAHKSSWSTTSTQPSRRSTESTRQDTYETPSRTPSTRGSFSNTSRKGSVVSRSVGRAAGEMSRKASVEKEKVVTVQELVGYVDSSDSDI